MCVPYIRTENVCLNQFNSDNIYVLCQYKLKSDRKHIVALRAHWRIFNIHSHLYVDTFCELSRAFTVSSRYLVCL